MTIRIITKINDILLINHLFFQSYTNYPLSNYSYFAFFNLA